MKRNPGAAFPHFASLNAGYDAMPLNDVKTWGYQLQNIKPAQIARTSYDLVVVDYASDDGAFSQAQVDQMKHKPDGSRRLVVRI